MKTFLLAILISTISYWAGAFSMMIDPVPSKVPTPRVVPSLVTVSNTQSVKAYPVDIKLRIVNAAEFNKSLTVSALKMTQQMAGVGAYTVITADPCEIVMPDDFQIEVLASKGEAWFTSDTGDVLAHEILHCLFGAWHQPWNKIESQSRTASSRGSVSPPWTKKATSGSTTPPPPTTPQGWSTR